VKIDIPQMLAELPLMMESRNVVPSVVVDDADDGSIPADLRSWLVRLRLLEGVPFAQLVADTELLPSESIRWFYIDRTWTDALVQGALSVGTVNTDDRTQLTTAYPAIRTELDQEERNLRRAVGDARLAGAAGPISGFLLRSQAVSGWPGMHVRAFDDEPLEEDDDPIGENDPRRMRLLRLERLAPAVLLCLFDGIPKVVHLEEPRQGIQFGFMNTGSGTNVRSSFPVRDVVTFEPTGADVTVGFRPGATGVVDIQALERTLKRDHPATGAADGLNSAEYALQLVRFPYRQVWGEPTTSHDLGIVFHPIIAYQTLVTTAFLGDVT
jgi:hypothetical protein